MKHGHIIKYCNDCKDEIARYYWDKIRSTVERKPLVFGESHDQPYVRAIVMELISEQLVKHLFIEVFEFPLADKQLAGEWLRVQITNNVSYENTINSDNFESLAARLGRVENHRSKNHDAGIPWITLIKLALQNRVNLYFWDNGKMGGTQRKRGHDRASPEGMELRHKALKEEIFKAGNSVGSGTVVIVGANHLDKSKAANKLAAQCVVPDAAAVKILERLNTS